MYIHDIKLLTLQYVRFVLVLTWSLKIIYVFSVAGSQTCPDEVVSITVQYDEFLCAV